MSTSNEPHPKLNQTRRHFLGLAAATSAKVAALGGLVAGMLPMSAQANGAKWWNKHGGGKGHMCFLRGTSIMTPTGEVCIERLKIGDLVETVRGKAMAVKWIGRHMFKRSGPAWHDSVLPIRIARHAFGQGTPHRDLYVSPGHALFIDGVLIRAKDLVNGRSITPALPAGREMIEYFHIVLDSHEAILAEGAAAETFLVAADNYEGFTNFAEFKRLYPSGLPLAMKPFAPIVAVDSGREQLMALLPSRLSRGLQLRRPAHTIREKIAKRSEGSVT
ncbi:Hint domain-containing protein [Pararhizobium sp. BT-229]|uniref:Hint domain-containing protein n=1 Tax=Pararhizobium sp. BT-229 TaxID=2986923 RepID=UPI0021F79A4B|nr:Hint domain-containing protein [Pararhizobium sp. BT-229]MCV9965436.1 Hint domain-containing protein [Pararhizobium sp. BT-229]